MGDAMWKRLERIVAEKLGGRRNYRGANFSQSLCDVVHPVFSIECKYRKKLPILYTDPFFLLGPSKHNWVVFHKDRVLSLLDTIVSELNGSQHPYMVYGISDEKKLNSFVESSYQQAISYDSTKLPILVMKEKSMRGEIAYLATTTWKELISPRFKEEYKKIVHVWQESNRIQKEKELIEKAAKERNEG